MGGYDAGRYARRRAAGLCTRCPERAAPGRTLCATCGAQNNALAYRIRAAHAAAGMCHDCGKVPPEDGWRRCRPCLDAKTERNRRNR